MEKLYTSKEIAEIYGVTQYTITNNWSKKGLKHIKGAKKGFLYRKEWVEEYIESQIIQKNSNNNVIDLKRTRASRNRNKGLNYVV